jgi:hypothetical protein
MKQNQCIKKGVEKLKGKCLVVGGILLAFLFPVFKGQAQPALILKVEQVRLGGDTLLLKFYGQAGPGGGTMEKDIGNFNFVVSIDTNCVYHSQSGKYPVFGRYPVVDTGFVKDDLDDGDYFQFYATGTMFVNVTMVKKVGINSANLEDLPSGVDTLLFSVYLKVKNCNCNHSISWYSGGARMNGDNMDYNANGGVSTSVIGTNPLSMDNLSFLSLYPGDFSGSYPDTLVCGNDNLLFRFSKVVDTIFYHPTGNPGAQPNNYLTQNFDVDSVRIQFIAQDSAHPRIDSLIITDGVCFDTTLIKSYPRPEIAIPNVNPPQDTTLCSGDTLDMKSVVYGTTIGHDSTQWDSARVTTGWGDPADLIVVSPPRDSLARFTEINTIGPRIDTIFVSYGPCYRTDTLLIESRPGPSANFRPTWSGTDTTLCPGTQGLILTADSLGCVSCTFEWQVVRGLNTVAFPYPTNTDGRDTLDFGQTSDTAVVQLKVDDGSGCVDSVQKRFIVADTFKVAVKVYLEGYYNGTNLNNTLYTAGILGNYFGFGTTTNPMSGGLGDSIKMVPGRTVPNPGGSVGSAVDVVQIALLNSATDYAVDSVYAWLMQDGTIRDFQTGDHSFVSFCVASGSYIISVRHRNHLPIASSASILMMKTPPATPYNLTNGFNVYGYTLGAFHHAKEVGPGVVAMIAGNVNNTGSLIQREVNAFDYYLVYLQNGVLSNGYYIEDLNGDSDVNAVDLNLVSVNNDELYWTDVK